MGKLARGVGTVLGCGMPRAAKEMTSDRSTAIPPVNDSDIAMRGSAPHQSEAKQQSSN